MSRKRGRKSQAHRDKSTIADPAFSLQTETRADAFPPLGLSPPALAHRLALLDANPGPSIRRPQTVINDTRPVRPPDSAPSLDAPISVDLNTRGVPPVSLGERSVWQNVEGLDMARFLDPESPAPGLNPDTGGTLPSSIGVEGTQTASLHGGMDRTAASEDASRSDLRCSLTASLSGHRQRL